MTEGASGQRVLVVDDTAEMRALIRRALTAHGFRVDAAATLAQARAMGPGGYDAIIVDAHLGADRGTELVETLRVEDPAAVGRCLVISGGSLGGVPDGVASLRKPFQLDQLVAAVRSLTPRPGAGADRERVTAVPTTTGSGWLAPSTAQPTGTPRREPSRANPIAPAIPAQPAGTRSAPRPRTPTGEPGTARQAAPGTGRPTAPATSPAAGDGQAWRMLAIIRRLRARERAELAGYVHDGPMQELAAATLAAGLMRGQASVSQRQRLDDLAERLAAAGRALRRLADADWPFPRLRDRPEVAVRERTAWLLSEPASTDMPQPPAALTAAEAEAVADVAELGLLSMADGAAPRAHIEVQAAANRIVIGLAVTPAGGEGSLHGDPGAVRASVGELAWALGATADTEFGARRWRVRITVPRARLAGSRRDRGALP